MSQVKISEVLIHGLSVLAVLCVRCVSPYYICMLWHGTHVFSLHAFKVFEAVIAWVNHDKDVRQEFMARLMEHVRLPLLPREYLVQVSARTHHGGVAASEAWQHVEPLYPVGRASDCRALECREEDSLGTRPLGSSL